MSLALSSRLTFSSPAADRIREAERRAMERMAREAAARAPVSIVPPPTPGPLYEGAPDKPVALVPMPTEWWWWTAEAPPPRYPSISRIQQAVCREFKMTRGQMLCDRRHRAIVFPRQVAMYLAKVLSAKSLPEIGLRFGGRDHTTVLHAVRKIDALLSSDPDLAERVTRIRKTLEPPVSACE